MGLKPAQVCWLAQASLDNKIRFWPWRLWPDNLLSLGIYFHFSFPLAIRPEVQISTSSCPLVFERNPHVKYLTPSRCL